MDVALLDTLCDLFTAFEERGYFEVISGYRSPHTNEALRHATTGVAEHSLHIEGRAVDVRLTSAKTAALRDLSAHVVDGRVPHSTLLEVFTSEGFGTMVVPS